MIKLFSLKQQKKDGTDTTARTGQKKATAAQLRITKGTGNRVSLNHDGTDGSDGTGIQSV